MSFRELRKNATRCGSLLLASFLCPPMPTRAADWATWRGPGQNGMAYERAVVTKWSPDGENLLWKSPEGGRTTPLVMNGRVYFIGPVGDGECLQERVICLDAETGKTLWEYRFNVFFTDIVANRVGWTALAGDEETVNLYAHGTGGEMLCLDRDGKVLWKHSLTEEYNRVSGYGGRLVNPAIDEDRVIVSFLSSNWGNHAKPAHRFVAFDKRTGKVVWWAESQMPPVDTVYATPVVTVTAADPDASEVGLDPGTFTITRTGDTAAALNVSYTLTGTALLPDDYTRSPSGANIQIPAGQVSANLTITPVLDPLVEGAESVIFTVTDGIDYDVGVASTATVNIADSGSGTALTVINTNDSGAGSLRQAMLTANATAGLENERTT